MTPSRFALLLLVGFALVGAASPLAGQTLEHEGAPEHSPELAAATFDAAWERIAETHFDPDMGGLDWQAVRAELRPAAVASGSMDELRDVLRTMLARLDASHFAILEGSAGSALADEDAPAGDADPGITLRLVGDRVLVSELRSEGSAAAAGIRPGWELTQVGEYRAGEVLAEARESLAGRPDRHRLVPLYVPSALEARMRGPEGSTVELTLRDSDDRAVDFSLSRSAPGGTHVRFGNLGILRVEASSETLSLADGTGRVGLIRFSSWFPVVVPTIARAVDEHRTADGLVFDLRGNPGGIGGLVMGIAGHLLDERVDLGELTTRESTLRFAVNPQRVGPDGTRVTPFTGPVAILVDGLSVSTSEIFAGGLQALGRARIFGEPTPGQALPALISTLPNGDRMMHAIADYRVPDGTRLEGRGVHPDEPAPLTREALLEGRDPALEAALRWLAETHGPGSP